MKRVAVVTGGNKGIGFAIVKGLCTQFDGIVYLTARDVDRGLNAVKELEKEGLKPTFHQLDITNDESVTNFRDHLKNTHGRLDVLVNNAAIAFKTAATEPFGVQAEETIKVNYFATKRVCDALFPLLQPGARVVHVSSSAGLLQRIPGEELKQKLSSPTLSQEELDDLMRSFVSLAKENKHLEAGWGNSAYVASKVGVSALSRIHQRMFDTDPREDIVVNAVHPGYVDTDMTSHKGHLTIEEGAIGPLFCALLPPKTDIKGAFVWNDKTIMDWAKST